VAIDNGSIPFNGVDHVRGRPQSFIGDCGKEGGEIDRPDRFRAEYKRIVMQTFAVDLGF
jgi:hypothetical protein